jgi:hypothetical protein
MRHRRYRAIALVLDTLVLGCSPAPMESREGAATSTPPPQAAGAEQARNSKPARPGRAKATVTSVAPLPMQGHVD